jgi:DMSO/TMAO reductase YedYZ molybdopterin-dependent catalytic subunit
VPDTADNPDRPPSAQPGGEPASPPSRPVGRRIVLGMLGLGALGVLFGKHLQDAESAVLAPLQEHDPSGLTSLLPAGDTFRFYSVTYREPQRTPADYRLDIDGLVQHPVTLTLADLDTMPQTTMVEDFQCVTGWRVPQVHWAGVALPDLLDRVGVQPQARACQFRSFDGTYTESLTLEQARRRDVLVATQMLGGPVSRAHGGPVRLYVAPMYGYKSCKWLGGIRLTEQVIPGYWEGYGYDVDAWVGRSNGRDDAPTG